MKKFMLSIAVVAAIGFTSCSSDDDSSGGGDDDCVTCAAYDFQGVTVPAIDVCEGENGNAFVEGIDTEVAFDTYISALEQLTDCD